MTGASTRRATRRRPPSRPRSGAGVHPTLLVVGVLVCLLLAGVVSFYASNHPDGLVFVAGEKGFLGSARAHASDGSPFAGYATRGIDNARLSGGIAGIVGVVFVLPGLLAGPALFTVLRRRGHPDRQRRLRWAPDTATTCTSTGTRRSTACPRTSSSWPSWASSWSSSSRRGRPSARMRVYLALVLVASARVPGAVRLLRQADGRRGAVRGVRPADAVRGHRAPGLRRPAAAVASTGCVGAWALLAKGTLGVMASWSSRRPPSPGTSSPGSSSCACPTSSCRSWASWSATSRSSPARWPG